MGIQIEKVFTTIGRESRMKSMGFNAGPEGCGVTEVMLWTKLLQECRWYAAGEGRLRFASTWCGGISYTHRLSGKSLIKQAFKRNQP